MSAINPPPIRVPKKFAQDKELFGYFNSLHIYLRQLWERAAPAPGVSDSDSLQMAAYVLSAPAQVSALAEEVGMLRAEMSALYGNDIRYTALIKEIEYIKMEVASLQSLNARTETIFKELEYNKIETASLRSLTPRTEALVKRIEEVELLCLSP